MSYFDLNCRTVVPEQMDQPDLDADQHQRALTGLGRLNRWSRSIAMLWPKLREIAAGQGRPVRVLDVASGGGDIAIALRRKARRADLPVKILGVDISPVAVQYARSRAEAIGADVQFQTLDVVADPFPDRYDVVFSSLFLHHLQDDAIVTLLAKMARATERLLLIDDLRRCRTGYLVAHLACRALSRSSVVHVDGLRSVASALDQAELLRLFHRAGLSDVHVRRRWPIRVLAEWRPR